jgi:aminomethyltransferase
MTDTSAARHESVGHKDSESSNLQRTPLFSEHLALGAKMVPFAGWEMPVQYPQGLKQEHLAVRAGCGIFDVSHMGEVFVRGPQAYSALQYLTCNDVAKLSPGGAQYSALLTEEGGVVDDIIVYCLSSEEYLVCVNAGNATAAFSWMQQQGARFDAVFSNESSAWAQIAIQGPQAWKVLGAAFGSTFQSLAAKPAFSFEQLSVLDASIIAARTGYTGEDGIEIFIPSDRATQFWQALLKTEQVCPAGLGARDTLRLEVCYPLHGHELRRDLSALQSGLGWIVKFDKGEFLGREALLREKQNGIARRLVAFEMEGRAIAREETPVLEDASPSADKVGFVTSGTLTPSLGKPVGMALVPDENSKIGSRIFLLCRGKVECAVVVKKPLYARV